MESVRLLYFAFMETSIVGFVCVKYSVIVKHSTLTPIEVLNLFSILLVIFWWKQEVLCNKNTVIFRLRLFGVF